MTLNTTGVQGAVGVGSPDAPWTAMHKCRDGWCYAVQVTRGASGRLRCCLRLQSGGWCQDLQDRMLQMGVGTQFRSEHTAIAGCCCPSQMARQAAAPPKPAHHGLHRRISGGQVRSLSGRAA